MENRQYPRFAPTALLMGNFVTGCTILAPVGMLPELAEGFGVTITLAGALLTFGAVVLCICSPLTAWLTSRFDRRALLSVTVLVLAVGNLLSAWAPNYATLLIVRLLMLSAAALFTPQATAASGVLVPPNKRGAVVAFIFLGWSFATLFGLPAITFVASRYGWQSAFLIVALLSAVTFFLLVWRIPKGLKGMPVDVRTWIRLGRDPVILLLLAVTALLTSGQFALTSYLGPLLLRLVGAGPDQIGFMFIVNGVFGVVGNLIASRVVDPWGSYRTALIFNTLLIVGSIMWLLAAGNFTGMVFAIMFVGLGFASTSSLQQIRLMISGKEAGAAAVSLNTSGIYVGQAVGSATTGLLYAQDWLTAIGLASVGFFVIAVTLAVWAGWLSGEWGRRFSSAHAFKDIAS